MEEEPVGSNEDSSTHPLTVVTGPRGLPPAGLTDSILQHQPGAHLSMQPFSAHIPTVTGCSIDLFTDQAINELHLQQKLIGHPKVFALWLAISPNFQLAFPIKLCPSHRKFYRRFAASNRLAHFGRLCAFHIKFGHGRSQTVRKM